MWQWKFACRQAPLVPGLQSGVTPGMCLLRNGFSFMRSEVADTHAMPTHLTQFFLVIWTYSLPVCLVPAYGPAGEEASGQTPSLQSAHLLGSACSGC